MRLRVSFLFSALVLGISSSSTRGGLGASSLVLEATFTSVANGWVKVERWRDMNPNFIQEDFPPDGRGDQDGQRATFFGTSRPHSSQFLLYYAPGWDTNPRPVPVLLVHGANYNADLAWANPAEAGPYACGAATCPSTGLMQFLSARGYKVFAINFPHRQGDNYFWAQLIRDAIQVVKARTGAAHVDIVAWSKGAFAARMYVSGVRTWGDAYANDVRKLVLIGSPNAGTDWTFRHGWSHNFLIWPECGGRVNGPSPHTGMVCWGLWRFHPELSVYRTPTGDFFPGARQMLARWDGVYPLPLWEQDSWSTYYGGWGVYTFGYGIQFAIDQGSLVSAVLNASIPASVQVYLLSGNAADIPGIHNEHTGPSDGIVFVASSANTRGINTVSGNVILNGLNHLKLIWADAAMNQIESWLQ
ncbi:hypothetical protein HRbin08_00069 [bacterium HR08]|nr:hypothetical protein HRbin08_00069 [bacterium HR08]